MDEQEWVAVCGVLNQTLNHLRNFRKEEGAVMEADLQLRINNILSLLGDVTPFENERIIRVRERLRGNIEEVIGRDNYDSNRFEQELVFYLEKMDMSEEKLRLEQHCKYFLEQMKNNKNSVGRTINFISQEIGREINTLGAKAYDSDIQRVVVQMTDELEKIKEQLANVL